LSSRVLVLGAALAVAIVGLTSCGTDPEALGGAPSAPSEQQVLVDEQCRDAVVPTLPDLPPGEASAGTRTVTTEFGDRTLPTNPAGALGMYTTDVDLLIWLRYPLASSQPIRGDSGYKTFPCYFPARQLQGISTFANYPDYDYESVLAAKPDFILNGLGYDKKAVKRLDEIAPTYSVNAFDEQSWMTHFQATAAALGREQYYQEWKKLYDERLRAVAAKISNPSEIVVAPVAFWEGKVTTACYAGVECQVFKDLGFTIHPTALAKDGGGTELSGEQIGQLKDLDWAFMTTGTGPDAAKEDEKLMAEAAKNPQWKALTFVTKNQIARYEMEMTYGSPSGQLAFLDVLENALAS
jgi:iron complex transport system substrate-binding protein